MVCNNRLTARCRAGKTSCIVRCERLQGMLCALGRVLLVQRPSAPRLCHAVVPHSHCTARYQHTQLERQRERIAASMAEGEKRLRAQLEFEEGRRRRRRAAEAQHREAVDRYR